MIPSSITGKPEIKNQALKATQIVNKVKSYHDNLSSLFNLNTMDLIRQYFDMDHTVHHVTGEKQDNIDKKQLPSVHSLEVIFCQVNG